MKEINLTPKATEDLEAIWLYSQVKFGSLKLMNILADFLTSLTCWLLMKLAPEGWN